MNTVFAGTRMNATTMAVSTASTTVTCLACLVASVVGGMHLWRTYQTNTIVAADDIEFETVRDAIAAEINGMTIDEGRAHIRRTRPWIQIRDVALKTKDEIIATKIGWPRVAWALRFVADASSTQLLGRAPQLLETPSFVVVTPGPAAKPKPDTRPIVAFIVIHNEGGGKGRTETKFFS